MTRNLIFDLLDAFHIHGVFSGQFLLRLARRLAAEADDAIFDEDIGCAASDISVEQERHLNFGTDPTV